MNINCICISTVCISTARGRYPLLPLKVLGGPAGRDSVVVHRVAHVQVLLGVLPRGLVFDRVELEREARVALDARETGGCQRQIDADVYSLADLPRICRMCGYHTPGILLLVLSMMIVTRRDPGEVNPAQRKAEQNIQMSWWIDICASVLSLPYW